MMAAVSSAAATPTRSAAFVSREVERTSVNCRGTRSNSSLEREGTGNNWCRRACFSPWSKCRVSRRAFCVSNCLSSASGSNAREYVPMVKMCGIASAEDAAVVAQAGASFVGMIMWPHSKRSVTLSAAKEICAAAREFGAEPVGVFVSESAREIETACAGAGLSWAQLHGDGARASVLQLSRSGLKTVFVMQSDIHGRVQTGASPEQENAIDWVLVDGLEGGSGVAFNWDNFKVPSLCMTKGWLLAGGLNAENVANALSTLRPHAVDVASGIAGPDGIRKDHRKVLAFMQAVKASTCAVI